MIALYRMLNQNYYSLERTFAAITSGQRSTLIVDHRDYDVEKQ